jgi:hypothetical protein
MDRIALALENLAPSSDSEEENKEQ